jgi:PAS domain S-box-containing protein
MRTILFIENDEWDKHDLETIFSERDDHNYLLLDSIPAAIEAIKNRHIDIILVDYSMGHDEIMTLISEHHDIPVIIIAAIEEVEQAVTLIRSGAYDILIKDFGTNYLKFIEVACQQAIKSKNQELHLAKLRQAVEQNPCLIVITDCDGIIEYANPIMFEITGYDPEELLGKHSKIFNSGEHDIIFYKNMWKTLSEGHKWIGELYNKTKKGDFYWELASIAPLKNKAGVVTHFIKIGENITEMKKFEKEKMESDRNKTVLEIAGAVSHELNQPLQIILGYTELLKERLSADESATKHFQKIMENINRILTISKKLKNITDYRTTSYLDGVVLDIHQQEDKKE